VRDKPESPPEERQAGRPDGRHPEQTDQHQIGVVPVAVAERPPADLHVTAAGQELQVFPGTSGLAVGIEVLVVDQHLA
jgi:hypothetical protein